MTLEEIINNHSNTPLTQEELDILRKEDYILNIDTPDRIKNSRPYLDWIHRRHPRKYGLYLENFDDIEIDENNYRAFASNNTLLRKSLIEDYDHTLDILIKYGAKITDIKGIKDILNAHYFSVDHSSMNYFMHVNPELINVSLSNDHLSTIQFLCKNRVFISMYDREEFKRQLKEINFVVSPSNLEMALYYHDALWVSLENDEITTLSTRIYETLDAIRDDSQLYVEYLNLLEKHLTREIGEDEKYYIEEMLYAVNCESELLFSCLNSRSGRYLFLEKLADCPMYVRLDTYDSLRLNQELVDMNFNAIETYPNLLKRNVNFLLATLENDFDSTVEYVKDKYYAGDLEFLEDAIQDNLSEEEYFRFKELLLKNDFNDPLYCYIDSNALRVLSETNPSDALIILGALDDGKRLTIPAKTGAQILKNIVDRIDEVDLDDNKDNIAFRLLPTLKETAKKVRNILSIEDKEYVIEAFNKGIIPMSFIPDEFFEDDFIVNRLNIDARSKLLLIKMSMDSYKYNPRDEELLLDILGKDSLQSAIIPLKNKTRSELTIEEMMAIKIYGIKTLNHNDLMGYELDVFKYSDEHDELGSENNNSLDINLYNGHNRTVYEMIKTIHHEINHAIQFKDMNECNFKDDEDILDYAKDDILKYMFMDYYSDNYNVISYEYDTEMKAILLADAFFDNKNITREYVKNVHYDLKYSKNNYRKVAFLCDNKQTLLDNLFQEAVRIKGNDLNNLKNVYPCLQYDYYIGEDEIRRYSVDDLVDIINSNISNEEREKYLVVLKRRINSRKDSNFQDNRARLLTLNEKGRFPDNLARDINLYNPIIEIKEEFKKYMKYLDYNFDRINKLLNKKQRRK